MVNKICGQVNIPEIDNSLGNCDNFLNSECIVVTYKSTFIKNKVGDNLDTYLKLLDNRLNKMNNQIFQLTKLVETLENQISGGIGVFPTT